jgi:hypothetical protein
LNFASEELDSVTVCAYISALPPNIPVGSNWVHRYYSITPYPAEGSFETNLILFYEQDEFNYSGLLDESELWLYRYNDSESMWEYQGGGADIARNCITLSGCTDFSLWAMTDLRNAVDVPEFDELPAAPSLSQNYPNPFNPATRINYALHKDCHVRLAVYNILGQRVIMLVDEHQAAGYRTVLWDGKNQYGNQVASGIYFYQLQAGDFVETKKMVLLR